MYIRTSLVCSTLRVSSIRIFILIDPIYNNGYRRLVDRMPESASGGGDGGWDGVCPRGCLLQGVLEILKKEIQQVCIPVGWVPAAR